MFFVGIVRRLIREKDFCLIYARHLSPTENFLLAIQGKKSLEKENPSDLPVRGASIPTGVSHTPAETQQTSKKALPSLAAVVKVAPVGINLPEVFFYGRSIPPPRALPGTRPP